MARHTPRWSVLLSVVATALLMQIQPPQARATGDPVQVFILGGQSNMVGHGKTEYGANPDYFTDNTQPREIIGGPGSLRYMVANNWATFGSGGTKPLVNNTLAEVLDTSIKQLNWVTRDDVNIYARTEYREDAAGNVTVNGVTRTGELTVGGFAATNNSRWIGPELGFGFTVGDALDQDALIIKVSTGGTSLNVDWRSPTAVANRGGSVGYMWDHMLNTVNTALTNTGADFPEYAGRGYEIAGFGWHQGYNDVVTSGWGALYEDNLTDFIADVRSEFGTGLPFVIGTTSMWPPTTPDNAVELAQRSVAAADAHTIAVDTGPFWGDATESPSNFGYHWNHNGITHYDIGVGMGEAMAALIPEPASAMSGLAGLALLTLRRKR